MWPSKPCVVWSLELSKRPPRNRLSNSARIAPAPIVSRTAWFGSNRVRLSYAAAPSTTTNRFAIVPAVAGIFFPLRPVLQLDGLGFSPSIFNKIIQTAGRAASFKEAAELLKINAEFTISGRYVNELTKMLGLELQQARDERTESYVHHRRRTLTGPVPAKVAVSVDGGRVNTRQPGQGPGVHDPGWREDKVGCLQVVEGPTFAADPHPEPPRCFVDKEHVRRLVKEFQQHKGLRSYDAAESSAREPLDLQGADAVPALSDPGEAVPGLPSDTPMSTCQEPPAPTMAKDAAWPPKRAKRTCVASLQCSSEFAKMLAAEAYERNFFSALERAFLGDGLAYNWTIQQKWFADFVGILDFIHPLSYLFASAGVVCGTPAEQWQTYLHWMTACWQGKVADVLQELCVEQGKLHERLGEPPEKMKANDAREVLRKTIHYLENNAERMNYPDYRRRGLPITSVAVESLIKEFNLRVKGTEKFWDDPQGTEAILQVRAGVLSEDNRLQTYIANRPGNPFRRHAKGKHGKNQKAA
jgi:hypothetical protein